MALPDLTGQFIQDTYKRVLTVGEGGNMFDGTGSLFIPLSASHEIIKEVSSSYADTASLAQELVSTKRAEVNSYVYIGGGTTLQAGTVAALYLGTSNGGMDIARYNDSSLVLGGVTQNYGWRLFGIKHGLNGNTYTTEIDNLIATGSMKVSGSMEINLASGSAFSIVENDVDQANRLDFNYSSGDPTLIVASRSGTAKLHLKADLAGNGVEVTNAGIFRRTHSGVLYGFQQATTSLQPISGNQLDLGYYNRRWKTLYLYTGNKVSWGTTTNSDLAAIQHTAGSSTLTVTGSGYPVILNVEGGISSSALSVNGSSRTLFTSASMVYSGSNVTQVTQSYEAGTQQITNIFYSGSFSDGNPLSISVTGSDGVNKLYSMTYSEGNITQILVT